MVTFSLGHSAAAAGEDQRFPESRNVHGSRLRGDDDKNKRQQAKTNLPTQLPAETRYTFRNASTTARSAAKGNRPQIAANTAARVIKPRRDASNLRK